MQSGIETDSLTIGKYKVEKLYLKLDKKFTLKAQNITIPHSKEKPSFDTIDKTFDQIKYLFTFFESIELKNIRFENNHFDFAFSNDSLSISSDDYELTGNISKENKVFKANISKLTLKKRDITLKGSLTYDLNTDILDTKGTFEAYHIKGFFTAKKDKKDIDFSLKSDTFRDLRTLINTFKFSPKIKTWIVEKVQAKKYRLKSLKGRIVQKNDRYAVDFNTLKGEMLFENVKIFFNPKLVPILAKKLTLKYKNDALYFDLNRPLYKKKSLKGSKITIKGLSHNTMLKLDLKMRSLLDKELAGVLASYGVHIPAKYKGIKPKIAFRMNKKLGKWGKHKKSSIDVKVHLSQGVIRYKNLRIPLAKATVTYNNQRKNPLETSVYLKKGQLQIGKVKLAALGGQLHYSKNFVRIDKLHLNPSWYKGTVSGKINIKKKIAHLKLNAKRIVLGKKEHFFVLQNEVLPLLIDYNKRVELSLPTLGVKIKKIKNNIHIVVKKVEKLKKYLKDYGLNIDKGSLEIVKKDEAYTFKGRLHKKGCFLYQNDGLCHANITIRGKVKKGKLSLYAYGKKLHYNADKSQIKLNNIHIDLKKFLKYKKRAKRNKQTKSKKLVIIGKNSKIRYGKHTLLTDSYDIEISAIGHVNAVGSLAGDIVKFSKKDSYFSLKALRIKDKMLYPLIGFKGLKKGRYTLKMAGSFEKTMQGQIIVEGGVLKDFKAYNNTLALMNALPALATFNSPGFSSDGFKIKEGLIDYRMIGDKIIFDSIYIKGHAATIAGRGEIDIKSKKIKMDLAIQTGREFGKIVSKIPVLGYLLMGKDRSITVGLRIEGTLDNPKVETSTAKEILTLPLQIIKRIFKK